MFAIEGEHFKAYLNSSTRELAAMHATNGAYRAPGEGLHGAYVIQEWHLSGDWRGKHPCDGCRRPREGHHVAPGPGSIVDRRSRSEDVRCALSSLLYRIFLSGLASCQPNILMFAFLRRGSAGKLGTGGHCCRHAKQLARNSAAGQHWKTTTLQASSLQRRAMRKPRLAPIFCTCQSGRRNSQKGSANLAQSMRSVSGGQRCVCRSRSSSRPWVTGDVPAEIPLSAFGKLPLAVAPLRAHELRPK